jgi:hypothetical protein
MGGSGVAGLAHASDAFGCLIAQELCQLIDDCMDPDPARRPTAKECFDRIKICSGGDIGIGPARMPSFLWVPDCAVRHTGPAVV